MRFTLLSQRGDAKVIAILAIALLLPVTLVALKYSADNRSLAGGGTPISPPCKGTYCPTQPQPVVPSAPPMKDCGGYAAEYCPPTQKVPPVVSTSTPNPTNPVPVPLPTKGLPNPTNTITPLTPVPTAQ